MGFPRSLFISTLAVPPGTQTDRQLGGPGADPKYERRATSPEAQLQYDLISPPDEFSCVGLRHCQRVLTS